MKRMTKAEDITDLILLGEFTSLGEAGGKYEEEDEHEVTEEDLHDHDHDDVFDLCTHVLINSTVAQECGSYFKGDIMQAMHVCITGIADV